MPPFPLVWSVMYSTSVSSVSVQWRGSDIHAPSFVFVVSTRDKCSFSHHAVLSHAFFFLCRVWFSIRLVTLIDHVFLCYVLCEQMAFVFVSKCNLFFSLLLNTLVTWSVDNLSTCPPLLSSLFGFLFILSLGFQSCDNLLTLIPLCPVSCPIPLG